MFARRCRVATASRLDFSNTLINFFILLIAMLFTFEFISMFGIGLMYASPILIMLIALIIIMGLIVGWLEGWSSKDSVYYSFITATTVGYGDFYPKKKPSKSLAVVIAFIGIIFTGIVVGIALHASLHAFKATHNTSDVMEHIDKSIEAH